MTQTSGRAKQPNRQVQKPAKKSGLDVIHSITGNDQRTGRTIKLLWHVTAAVCVIVVVLVLVLGAFVAPSLPSLALPGLGTGVVGIAGYLFHKRRKNALRHHDS